MSLAFAEQMLKLPLPHTTDKNFARVLATKQSIAATILSVTARVSASSLRSVEDDGLGELLAKLEAGDRPTAEAPIDENPGIFEGDLGYPDPFS